MTKIFMLAPTSSATFLKAFWQFEYPAIMVTDTALFRNPHYHSATDIPGTLDYDRLGRVVDGLTGMIEDLSGE
jgi:hypothetical protein